MKPEKENSLPYDPEKKERAIFQMVLTLIFLLLLAFAAAEILADLGFNFIKIIQVKP